jgi:putative addiction module component (TIGR02574 family)
MREEATTLLKRALSLPTEERAELASSLIDSLDPAESEDVEQAWQDEIARRIENVRAGRATMIPWEEVRKKADAVLHEKSH